MKNKILTLVVIGFTAGVVLAGCQDKGEKNSKLTLDSLAQAGVDSQAVKTTYSEDWQNFKNVSEQKIQNNEDSIAAFKEKMKKSGKKVKAGYKKEVANLEETNRQMKKKLAEYKDDGKNTWADFKAGFNRDMDKLGKAVKDLTSDND